jgi:curved DNA-binding protein CbpA
MPAKPTPTGIFISPVCHATPHLPSLLSPDFTDYYSVLHLSHLATSDEIKTAHRKLRVQYFETDANKYNALQTAYAVLIDGEARRNYDVVYRMRFGLAVPEEVVVMDEEGEGREGVDEEAGEEERNGEEMPGESESSAVSVRVKDYEALRPVEPVSSALPLSTPSALPVRAKRSTLPRIKMHTASALPVRTKQPGLPRSRSPAPSASPAREKQSSLPRLSPPAPSGPPVRAQHSVIARLKSPATPAVPVRAKRSTLPRSSSAASVPVHAKQSTPRPKTPAPSAPPVRAKTSFLPRPSLRATQVGLVSPSLVTAALTLKSPLIANVIASKNMSMGESLDHLLKRHRCDAEKPLCGSPAYASSLPVLNGYTGKEKHAELRSTRPRYLWKNAKNSD